MPRYYVEHEGKWNIFSSIVDDFLLEEFTDLKRIKRLVIQEDVERIREHLRDIDTLTTDKPRVNKMSYEEAMEIIKACEEEEDEDE